MYYVGCDQHKHYSQVVAKDAQGMIQNQEKLYHDDREALVDYFQALPPSSAVALEASGFEPWLYDLLEELGLSVKLVHPKKTRAIAEEKIKTDKLSASVLADLLRANLICQAYHAPAEVRQQRYLTRYRLSLVHLRTSLKNKTHGLLDRLGIRPPDFSDLFGQAGRRYLESLRLAENYQRALNGYLELMDQVNELLKPIEKDLKRINPENQDIELLKTLPGIGPILAHTILAEIADIHRFSSSSRLASYAGMIPSMHQSGQRHYMGHITKEGNRYLRWAFVEAAQKAILYDSPLRSFYSKIFHKKGRSVAMVAVGHKLLTYAYCILKEQKPYQARPCMGNPVVNAGPLAVV